MKSESNKIRIAYSILFNVIILVIALTVFVPFFEEIDDTHIAMLSEGAYGNNEWRLIYVNVILGKLYTGLARLFPMVRWHCVLQYVFVFISYVMVTYVISKHKHGYLMSATMVIATFYELYVSLQYTKTASFITASGVILFFEYVRNTKKLDNISREVSVEDKVLRKENIVFVCVGILLIYYGSLLRVEAALIACVPLFFIGCLELVRTKKILNYLMIFIPTFVLVFSGIVVNTNAYRIDSEWNDFMRYNKARMQLTDYRYDILYYPDNGERLAEMGITENDALMIVTIQFADDNIYSTEYMENISNVFGKKPFNLKVFRMLYGAIKEEIMKGTVIVPALILFVIILFATIITEKSRSHPESITDARLKLAASILMGLICAAAVIYFEYSGRWSHRLIGALFVPAVLGISYMLDGGVNYKETKGIVFGGNIKDKTVLFLIISCVVITLFNGLNLYRNQVVYKNSLDQYKLGKDEQKEIASDKDNLYVFDTFTFQYAFKYDVFKPNYVGELDNFVSCGSWFINSPITRKQCQKFSYNNPYEALRSGASNVVLLDNCYPKEKALFLTEHYGDTFKEVKIKEQNGFNFYKMELEN